MSVESGIRPGRLEFVRETDPGVTPTDPDWLRFSDSYQSVSYTPTATMSERRRVGHYDVQNHSAGAEDHTFEVEYDLQRWFVDGSGDPLDAAGDGMLRNEFGEVFATHSVVERIIMGGRGTAGAEARQYVVHLGAKIGTVTGDGEPESGDPFKITLGYTAEKSRVYRLDQPDGDTTLTVKSTDAGDTTQSLELEDDDAGTSESVDLDGTTEVTTTASFGSIDAALLSAECEGDVTVEDSSGNVLLTIFGRDSYQDREGDLGIPPLGNGSHGAEVGGDFESLLGDTFERGGSPLLEDVDINSAGFTIDNNLDPHASHKTIGKRINEGDRSVSLNTTVFGPTASYDVVNEHLRVVESDIVWTFTGGTLTFPKAVLTDAGTISRETSQATMTIDNVFTSRGITVATA